MLIIKSMYYNWEVSLQIFVIQFGGLPIKFCMVLTGRLFLESMD